MAEVATVNSRGAFFRRRGIGPQLDAREFSTQTQDQAGPVFAFSTFNTGGEGDSEQGPFPPGEEVALVENEARNNGDTAGDPNMVFAELNSDGSVKREICRSSNSNIGPDGTVSMNYDEGLSICTLGDTTGIAPFEVRTNVADQAGVTQFWGLKVWDDSRAEPNFDPVVQDFARNVAPAQQVPQQEADFLEQLAVPVTASVVGGVVGGFINENL